MGIAWTSVRPAGRTMNELALRLQVFRYRRKSDTSSRFLLELGRWVLDAPRGPDAPPFLEIGTRACGAALLVLRLLDAVYPRGRQRPFALAVDPWGSRPDEGAPFVYDERHRRAMKRTLPRFPNHIGSHDSDIVCGEVELLLPRVVPGGFRVVDDTKWFGGEVRSRLEAAAPRLWGTPRQSAKQSIVAVDLRPGP
jgi:hypothetical protein